MFASKIFKKIFISSTVAIVLLFAVMYLFFVPFIQSTVEGIEENSARTILNNVYSMVEQVHLELENYRQSIILEKKEQLRTVLTVVDYRVRDLLAEVRTGKMTRSQARLTLLNELRRIKYGSNDYVWASDYQSRLVSHPDPKLHGADFSKVTDSRGNLIVPPMVEMALKGAGDGYYSYWWHRLGEHVPAEKITYFRRISEFDIIIGTGVYLSDVEAMVHTKKAIAVDNLRERLHQTKVAKTGYVYVFDGQFVMQIHPNANIEYTNVSQLLDQSTQRPLFPLLVAVADSERSLRYLWDSPSDPGNYRHEKISWVRYFKEFDWYIGSSAYLDELRDSARRLRNRGVAIFVVTLLVSVTVIYLFVSRLTAPLLHMRNTAIRVIAGDLGARCSVQRDDEIGTVALALDGMVEQLQENIQQLDGKVAERTAELDKAYAELKEMDQLKSDILATISHELRTPMTSVTGFTRQVRKKLESEIFPHVAADEKNGRVMKQIRNNLDIIATESERLTRLIGDVLYCATLEAGMVDWRIGAVTPEQLVLRAYDEFLPQAGQKGLELSTEIEPHLPEVAGDEDRLFHVLGNLVGNAVKFTDHGHIVLRAGQRDGCVFFAVQDSGRGIAPEDQGRILGAFRQLGDTMTDKPGGTGLGLAICRQIIEHHGGKLRVESRLNAGSTFTFTVPIKNRGVPAENLAVVM